MIVMKFGGTSVGSAEAMERTIGIVRGRLAQRPVVVVSAMSKVTDMLYAYADAVAAARTAPAEQTTAPAAEKVPTVPAEHPTSTTAQSATAPSQSPAELLAQLRSKHLDVAAALIGDDVFWREEACVRVNAICDFLATATDKVEIVSRGEYLSSNIMYCAMNSLGVTTAYADARDYIITDDERLQGAPDIAEIVRRTPKVIDAAFGTGQPGGLPQAVITQGFVSRSATGAETILGRGGSDYTASLIGMAVDATRIEIWTDVDGIRSADPRKVDHTLCIGRISFEEAAEMARAGAKVLHPKTIEPAVTKNIPVMVLNSMNPDGEGTTILQSAFIEDGVKSVSSKDCIAVVSVSEQVSPGNPSALLTKVCSCLEECRVKSDLLTVTPEFIAFTTDTLQNLDTAARKISAFADVSIDFDKAQISVIGKNISELKLALRGSSRFLGPGSLVTLVQGESYANISFVVPKADAAEALRQVHSYLFGNAER